MQSTGGGIQRAKTCIEVAFSSVGLKSECSRLCCDSCALYRYTVVEECFCLIQPATV